MEFNETVTKIKETFKERWKYYLVSYIIGYFISLRMTGVPDVIYLIPIKISAIFTALFLGTVFYYIKLRVPIYEVPFRFIKYGIIYVLFLLFLKLFFTILLLLGISINISPFSGFPS